MVSGPTQLSASTWGFAIYRASHDDYDKLAAACETLYSMPLYVDDTSDISGLEIRGKCRRLKQEHGLALATPVAAVWPEFAQRGKQSITIGQVLGMAAHLEGRGVVTQEAAGLAQKGGATWSHVQIAEQAASIHTSKVDMAKADLVLACDGTPVTVVTRPPRDGPTSR